MYWKLNADLFRQRMTAKKASHRPLRIVVLAVAAIGVSLLFPALLPYAAGADIIITTNALNIGILFTILAGFLMSISLSRGNELNEQITLELNKIRRIHHLSFNLAAAEETLGPWFKEMREAIKGYLLFFDENDIGAYPKGNLAFRSVTGLIYGLPARSRAYNSELYSALLDAVSTASEAREHIATSLRSFIDRMHWTIIALVSVALAVVTALSTQPIPLARLTTAITIFNVFVIMWMIYDREHMSPRRRRAYADLYVEDWKKLDIER